MDRETGKEFAATYQQTQEMLHEVGQNAIMASHKKMALWVEGRRLLGSRTEIHFTDAELMELSEGRAPWDES